MRPLERSARRQPQVAGQVTAGGEALHVSDEGDQGGSGDEADARDGAQAGNDRDLVGERLELGLDDTDAVLDVADLGAGFSEGGTQSVGQTGIGVGEQGRDPGKYMLSPEGDGATELAQQPADRIDTGGAGGEPGGTQAVQSGQSLLGDGLHGDGVNVLVAVRLEQPPSVGAVRLVTEDVGPGGMGREQHDTVAEGLEPAAPVVRRSAGLKQDGGRRLIGAELQEGRPGQPALLADLAGSHGHRNFENFLGHIDGDGGRFHAGLLLL